MKWYVKYKMHYIIPAIVLCLLFLLCFFLLKPRPHKLGLREVSFSQFPGWGTADTKKSLRAFQISCAAFLKQDPNKSVGSDYINLQASDWYPACHAAVLVDAASSKDTKKFFQTWFMPVEFFDQQPVQGLFTGYYMPLLHGSLTKTIKYNIPLYGLPSNLVSINLSLFDPQLGNRTLIGRVNRNNIIPFYTRAEINRGAIKESAQVIAWVDNTIDRSFLEIQGSGIIALDNGSRLAVGYIGENGAPYTAIAKVLIDQGVMTRDNASMQHIRSYLDAHPEKIDPVLNQNKSFVFFTTLRNGSALGAQGVALTPGYSMAVDHKWVPYGVPIWLDTTRPDEISDQQNLFQRLMVAQDTGGAIKGVVRGDVYWGAGERATAIAGKMKNQGHYWLLLPRNLLPQLRDKMV